MAQWYYQIMDDILGPVSLDELNEKVVGGEIDEKSLVRQGAGGEWVMVSDMKELKQSIVGPLGDLQPEDDGDSPTEIASGLDVKRSPLSLRPCSDCGTMVSKQASVCPKCGRAFHESSVEVRYKGEQPVPVLAFFAVLAIAFVALSPVVVYFVAASIAAGYFTDSETCMTIGLSLGGLQLVSVITCTLMGGAVGKPKMAYITGLFLGLFFGPMGVFVASAIDKRPKCGQCFSRLSGLPRECPSCHSRLIWKVETRWY
jgi:RNA polymerase subunit RPABC4/transcription elongation factor Spt4